MNFRTLNLIMESSSCMVLKVAGTPYLEKQVANGTTIPCRDYGHLPPYYMLNISCNG